MKAEDFIEFIEQGRRDKIIPDGLTLIAKRFRELEDKFIASQLALPGKEKILDIISKKAVYIDGKALDKDKHTIASTKNLRI